MKKTAIMKHELFLEHDPGYGHVESPDRLAVIYKELEKSEIGNNFIYPAFEPATQEVLALNHTLPLIARVAATAGKNFSMLDPDTQTSARSYDAACLAAGAVIKGIEMVTTGEADNCFALVRPPGHHAEADRAMGFCLFNNVAVAARHAIKNLHMQRILIIDWDLHHGNGTQHSFYDTDQVMYFSTHQYPYYPGSGALSELGSGSGEGYTINVPLPGGQDDGAFVKIFDTVLCPIVRLYKPELIIVSAGYDIYLADPLGAMGISAAGFASLARILLNLAAEVCDGRIVFALEGGYNLEGLKTGVMAVLAEMCGMKGVDDETFRRLREADVHLTVLDQAKSIFSRYWQF